MTPEQIEELKKAVEATKAACDEASALISDYEKCESDISRKYLSAAIKKHASSITSNMPAGIFG